MYRFYKLVFDKDGCPMKQIGNKKVFHPILSAYLIKDFVEKYERNGSQSDLKSAIKIFDLSIKNVSTIGDAYVFFYHPEDELTIFDKKFYSALTQARWIFSLCKLAKISNQNLDIYIKKFFNSLLIESDKGGVLKKFKSGYLVEEYPHEIPLFTLNGWLTTLDLTIKSRKYLDNLDVDYNSFLEKNFTLIEELLPLYDVESFSNSRYSLSGFWRLRFIFRKKINY